MTDVFVPNWEILEGLRTLFLSEAFSSEKPYWNHLDYLVQYDHTFGERIGWKWDSVLQVLKKSGALFKSPVLVDFGCGSGKASERYLQHLGSDGISECYLWDESTLAQAYSKSKLSSCHPLLKFRTDFPQLENKNFTLLISHVLNELSPRAQDKLLELALIAKEVIWVEPGTQAVSKKLIELREHFLKNFDVLAPCPHQGSCGLLNHSNPRNWCHFFAPPPQEIFHSSFWREFSQKLGIDLRSLPVSYLVLQRKTENQNAAPLNSERKLVLGGGRHFKGYSLIPVCSQEGVSEQKLMSRNQKQAIELIKESNLRIFLD